MRKPMVTRSFETMVLTVMVVDVTTQAVGTKEVTLSRVITDNKKLENTVRNQFTGNEKFVAITGTKTETKLYGMSEADFLKYSVELDPETRKILDTEDDTEDDTEE